MIGDSGPGLHRILLSGRKNWLQHLHSSDTWYDDGTFITAPRLFSRVYFIFVKKFDGVIPIMYALWPKKQRSTYSKMFEMLKDIKPTLNPTSFFCDFEEAAFTDMREAFSDVEIKGRFFPFITKYAQIDSCHGLHFMYKNDTSFSLKAKMILSLAFFLFITLILIWTPSLRTSLKNLMYY